MITLCQLPHSPACNTISRSPNSEMTTNCPKREYFRRMKTKATGYRTLTICIYH